MHHTRQGAATEAHLQLSEGQRCQAGEVALLDGVGSRDDGGLLGLPEDLPQVNHRDDPRLDGSRQHRARADRGQLIHVTFTGNRATVS